MAARSTEERIALIDAKISKKQEEIKTLEAQKQKLLHPGHHENCHGESKGRRPIRGRDRGEAGA